MKADADAAFDRGEYRVTADLLEALQKRVFGDPAIARRLAVVAKLRDAETAAEAGDCARVRALLEGIGEPAAAAMIRRCEQPERR